jgi:hypothetical protein
MGGIVRDPGAVWQRRAFLDECGGEGVPGGRPYDAHIAEVARSSGTRWVVTDNPRDFAGLERQGIRVLAAAAASPLLSRGGPASSLIGSRPAKACFPAIFAV